MKAILNAYKKATQEQINEGMNWYFIAHNEAVRLSKEHEVPFYKVCAIISALSPATPWDRNVWDADVYLSYGNEYKRYTTYKQNVRKCDKIMLANNFQEVLELFSKADKTRNFFLNIHDPMSDKHVTIDRHAMRVAEFDQGLTPKRYKMLHKQYTDAAKLIGILPQQLQGVTWLVQREGNNG